MTKDEGIAWMAVRHLIEGHRVIYVTTRAERMRAMMDRVAAAAPDGLVKCIYRGRGDERIRFRNGADISFHTPTRGARGITADVALLDEVSDQMAAYAELIVAGSAVGQVHRYVREDD